MPRTKVLLFRDDDGTVPILEWLDGLPSKVAAKCLVRLERLREFGHELRRPEADFLRDGIHELRVGFQGQNYRVLYFFHGNLAAVVSHGIVKERVVPPVEIERAIERMKKFFRDPTRFTYGET